MTARTAKNISRPGTATPLGGEDLTGSLDDYEG
jgi:hypothetical protein